MALAVESSSKVWLKVKIALASASPAVQEAFAQLKMYLATQKRNPDLQFVPFSAAQIVTNLGYCPDIDTARIYGVYFKGRRTTGTTAAFAALHDAADNAATTTTVVTAKFNITGQEAFAVYPNGFILATDVTVSCATAVGGATESAEADAADGFLIAGA